MASLHAREEAPVAARVVAFKKDFDNFYSRHSEKEVSQCWTDAGEWRVCVCWWCRRPVGSGGD